MTVKIITGGAPTPAAQISPLPVNVTGGSINVIEGVPVASVWVGPRGYYEVNNRQVTTDNPGVAWIGGDGATASDEVKAAGTWTDAQKTRFLAEFPDARPGLLYGIIYVAWGNSYGTIEDMYNTRGVTDTRSYRDRLSWAYDSGSFSLGKMFEPKTSSGGLWQITFPKPIPFHLGLRVSYDNGVARYYFCYSLDPDFA
ncbi:hypothetical protein LCGC14_0872990 [marine sediment metagenome]|uniref:Uncharacterized protein n=1 Tax=marine sediment metagenome TaxID=412755 RepID=A0A0F9RNR9_9ZZZZ